MDDHALADELASIGADIELATGLPMTSDPRAVVERDAPRLLAAVEAVLALHEVESITYYPLVCPAHASVDDPLRFDRMASCPDCQNQTVSGCGYCDEDWPCPTVRAVTGPLLGEEATGGG